MTNLNIFARVAKLVALLGFLLPWVLVSCSGNEIAHGSGVDMMTGHLQPSAQLAQMQAQGGGDATGSPQLGKGEPEVFVILAFAVIALGLVASLFLRGKAASITLIAAAVIGIGLCFYSFQHMHDALMKSAAHGANGAGAAASGDGSEAELAAGMQNAIAGAIQIQKQEGFWVTVGALVIAACFALVALVTPAPAPSAPAEPKPN